ncbi:MAG: hypothetical protein K2O40_03630, partial [Lachnospiraceae bacterium]|nr:hypothetical protein [Lachnospiraceae bacterium]
EFDNYIKEAAIDKWCMKRLEFNKLLVPFVRTQWKNWRENGVEQISNDVSTQFLFEDFREQIINQFVKWKKKNKRIAIWGIGRRGRCLLGFLDKNHLSADILIDSSEKKQGEVINGQIVSPPSHYNMDIIVVTAMGIVGEVGVYVQGSVDKDIRIVALDSIWEEQDLNA